LNRRIRNRSYGGVRGREVQTSLLLNSHFPINPYLIIWLLVVYINYPKKIVMGLLRMGIGA
jgi:hypothetical protein